MDKDFDNWNIEKKNINSLPKSVFCHEREIWWCALGVNIGSEQDGTGKNYDRPVLIIKRFNRESFLGVALTSRIKQGKYYFNLGIVKGKLSCAVLSQIRLIDSKRLIRKVSTLDYKIFDEIKTALTAVLFK